MTSVHDPIMKISPDPDCARCDGEGIDADPMGLFDYDLRGPCPHCWKDTAARELAEALKAAASEVDGK